VLSGVLTLARSGVVVTAVAEVTARGIAEAVCDVLSHPRIFVMVLSQQPTTSVVLRLTAESSRLTTAAPRRRRLDVVVDGCHRS